MRRSTLLIALVYSCSSTLDEFVSLDAGMSMPDSGSADTGAPDTGAPDTGAPDSGAPDEGQNLVPAATRVFRGPVVAANRRGEMLIVWGSAEPIDDVYGAMFKAEYRNGVWIDPSGPMDAISTSTRAHLSEPHVVLSENGDAIIAWSEAGAAYLQEYRDGAWLPRAAFLPAGLEASTAPSVAIDADGNAVMVWSGRFPCGSAVCCAVYRSEYRSGSWTHPAGVSDHYLDALPDPGGSQCLAPVAAIADNGDAVVVSAHARQIFLSERRGGQWIDPSPNAPISPAATENRLPMVAMSSNGDAVIVWRQDNLLALMRSDHRAGVWMHPADADDIFTLPGERVDGFTLATDDNGDALIARWSDGVYLSERRSGIWTDPSAPSMDDELAFDGEADIAMDAGEAVMVWRGSERIYRSVQAGGDWTHPDEHLDFISPPETQASRAVVALGSYELIVWREGQYPNEVLRRSWAPR